jgi:hypothetical protein
MLISIFSRCFAVTAPAWVLAAALALTGCADPKPPVGRWQGAYSGDDIMIAARLEIGADSSIRISAPDAISDHFTEMSVEERNAIQARLETGLEKAWPQIDPIAFSFDGKTFRKPGGVAPQMEWDDKTRTMTVIVYPGTHASVRMKLMPVDQFTTN